MQGLRYQELRVFLLARYARFRQLPSELNLERRDHRIEADSEQGKLDPLIAEAHESKEIGHAVLPFSTWDLLHSEIEK